MAFPHSLAFTRTVYVEDLPVCTHWKLREQRTTGRPRRRQHSKVDVTRPCQAIKAKRHTVCEFIGHLLGERLTLAAAE